MNGSGGNRPLSDNHRHTCSLRFPLGMGSWLKFSVGRSLDTPLWANVCTADAAAATLFRALPRAVRPKTGALWVAAPGAKLPRRVLGNARALTVTAVDCAAGPHQFAHFKFECEEPLRDVARLQLEFGEGAREEAKDPQRTLKQMGWQPAL